MASQLSIDIETFSSVDLPTCGMYKYVQSPDFEILLFGYSFDDEPEIVIDLTQKGRTLPLRVKNALQDPAIKKTAYNAAFEWYCINKYFSAPLEQWECTQVRAWYAGYAGGLALVAKALGLPEDKQKDKVGKALIKKFCVPNKKPTKNRPWPRILPKHEPEQWEVFKGYCGRDVVVEKAILKALEKYPLPAVEQKYWIMDMAINAAGVKTDPFVIDGALTVKAQAEEETLARMQEITGLDNPNSDDQIKKWLGEETGEAIGSLNKDVVDEVERRCAGSPEATELLALRKKLKKTSLAKYETLHNGTCCDGRFRGMLQFYGTKTGRWAGRAVQPQNLPRNYLKTLDLARNLLMAKRFDDIHMLYGNVQDTISQLIRTAFIPEAGNIFAIADYSAIEARVLSWLADEQWRLDVFNTHGKIYEASASAMFGVPLDLISKGNPEYELRAKGKVAELALGYQGSKGALVQMGALKMGLDEEELPDIVSRWRDANPRIRDLWYTVDRAAIRCVESAQPQYLAHGITIHRDEKALMITLPSGRTLYYIDPVMMPGRFDKDQIHYKGLVKKAWVNIQTYGGMLVENITQAVARDCLAEAMYRLYQAGYQIRFHVHDEVILEVPENDPVYNLDNAIEIMCEVPAWAPGLPLGADGFTHHYYKKD